MQGVIQPLTLLAVIIAGYGLKRIGIFKQRDYRVMQGVVFNFTLPAAIIHSFATNDHQLSMLWLSLFGMSTSLIPLLVIFLSTRHTPVRSRVFTMLNGCGMNVGNFCLPVVTALMGASASMPVIMFDIGNSVMACAGMYVLTTALLHIPQGQTLDPKIVGAATVMPYTRITDRHARWLSRRSHLRSILRSFITSVPFDTYLIMVTLMFLGLNLPDWVARFMEPISNANGFCSMLMVGMLMDLPSSRKDIRSVLTVIAWKLGFAVLFSLAAWYLLPFSAEVSKAIIMVCLAPTAVFSTLFTDRVLGNAKLAGFTLASTGLLSLALMTAVNLLIPV
ncbi:AEC family transporter [Bifidobacterium psychraerophilum]|uniref:AEC family transporter n=1 Tax=Bifidobacterium psychraerophilum TaxID=218140 RepID=UPI00310E5472